MVRRPQNPSESSGSFLCAASTGQWSDDLLEALGVDRSKLPQIVGSGSVIGKVSKEVAGETGVPSGTPVVAGSGDMMCQLLASGLTGSGQVSVVSGTSSIIATAAESPATDPRVMNLRLASGNWARFGIGDTAGVSFRWFADRLGSTVSAAGPSEVQDVYDRLTAEAAGVPPGSEGLLFFPYLLGERTLGSHMSRASFIGATLGHYRSHFARAVMEGITLEDRRALECLCPGGFSGPVRCTGGGATSPLWNRIRADVFAHPVQTLSTSEGGTQGAAILAGVGAGWYSDAVAGSEDVVRAAGTWEPDPRAVLVYDDVFATFCAVHDALGPEWQRWY